MDKQPYIDRMLEIENLTDALEDDDANWLLDWGARQMDAVLAGAQDPETAGTRANALMAVIRKINRIAGSYTDKSPRSLARDLADLQGLFQQAFGAVREPAENSQAPGAEQTPPKRPAPPETAARQLAQMETRPALEFLTRWYFEGSDPSLAS